MLTLGGAGGVVAGAILAGTTQNLQAQTTSGTYFNVRDFGASGNGTDNDQAAIQRAIAAASPDSGSESERNSRGGVVFLPAGTYLVDSIRLRRNVTLLGEGMGTIIIQANGTNTAVVAPSNQREYPVCISNLRIRGTRNPSGDGSNAVGILLNTTSEYGGFTVPDGQHIVNQVWVERTHAQSILIEHNCRGTLIADCWLSSSATSAGLTIDGSDSTISNTISRSHAGDGFQVISGNTRLLNCKAFFCRGNGFIVDSSRANLSVCEAQDNWKNGFHILAQDGMYTGCLADSNQISGFNVDPAGGTMGGICMTGFITLGRNVVQSGKPWVGQPIGLLVNNGQLNDSLFVGIARNNNANQLQLIGRVDDQTQLAQVVTG